MSILECAVQNSDEEIKPGFRLVINANMSDTADPRRRNANELDVSNLGVIVPEEIC